MVRVEPELPYSANGIPVENTGIITAANAEEGDEATAAVTPEVPLALATTAAKTIEPASAEAIPGAKLTATIGGENSSNAAVDSLTISDPADAMGRRLTFTNSDGEKLEPGTTAAIGFELVQRGKISELTGELKVINLATATKEFSPNQVLAGDPSTATLVRDKRWNTSRLNDNHRTRPWPGREPIRERSHFHRFWTTHLDFANKSGSGRRANRRKLGDGCVRADTERCQLSDWNPDRGRRSRVAERNFQRGCTRSQIHLHQIRWRYLGKPSNTNPECATASNTPDHPTDRWSSTQRYERQPTGPVSVVKQVTGTGAEYAPDSFPLVLQCKSAAGTDYEADVPLNGKENLTVTKDVPVTDEDLPRGSMCTVTEDPAAANPTEFSADTQAVQRDPQDPVLIKATNRYELAELIISKQVKSEAVDANGNPIVFVLFTIDVSCTFLGEPAYATGFGPRKAMSFNLMSNEEEDLIGLPAGANCSVTESDN